MRAKKVDTKGLIKELSDFTFYSFYEVDREIEAMLDKKYREDMAKFIESRLKGSWLALHDKRDSTSFDDLYLYFSFNDIDDASATFDFNEIVMDFAEDIGVEDGKEFAAHLRVLADKIEQGNYRTTTI